ncbi:MAG: hypothetical protein WC513_01160 [Bacteroidales bacterium]|jgi:hypothetical protein|nr:hypothetical protein [Bacteroidales bacterium]MDD2832201.1 hypothetical protein [Bacteroidales bacterium]MDD4474003.1 hypothetical protein [Bacteroidales bacterium]MDD5046980.1 hypothetical protein [Bacteroidales bacterium]MDD5517533.1 hypothetical protein [Bacteroidales bacterium]
MKKNALTIIVTGVCLLTGACLCIHSCSSTGQHAIKVKNFPDSLPKIELEEKTPQKYLMTAEYFNKDFYGNLFSKVKVTGEYTRGLDSGYVCWNNVYIAQVNIPAESYGEGERQDYMENIRYIPSQDMLEESFFQEFNTDNVFARNLIWDMKAIEGFAWDYNDSLQLNKTHVVQDVGGSFDMADIGTYAHTKVEVDWIGISMMNGKLCAIIEYRALDNKVELNIDMFKSKGTELYWGKTWVSLENKQIEYVQMYSNTVQEMEIPGMPDKMLTSTKRVLKLERIK